MQITRDAFMRAFNINLSSGGYPSPNNASTRAIHQALAKTTLCFIMDTWQKESPRKKACYLSAEFLLGRLIYNNLYCLGILEEAREWLALSGVDITRLDEIEDPALGNGGLGRLAACFLDSAATLNIPLAGYGIRYQYGLFRQTFVGGFQTEEADAWHAMSDPWSIRRDEQAHTIKFADQTVRAVPYDMPIIGYGGGVGTLRLWQAEPTREFDFNMFNNQKYDEAVRDKNEADDISRALYPNDDTPRGKRLRLRQQYFFTAASVADWIREHKAAALPWKEFPNRYSIQLNDTHPVIAIAELIRRLVDEERVPFDEAFEIARVTFNYTNHTIMAEALEKWNASLVRGMLPRILDIIKMIQKRFVSDMKSRRVPADMIKSMSIAQKGSIHMAHLAIYASSHTNGVAKIHTELLKNRELKNWYRLYPERFLNETNGITFRRWLGLCNPKLAELVNRLSGGDVMRDPDLLESLRVYADDADVTGEFAAIRSRNKADLAGRLLSTEGVVVDPDSLFDIHIKRLHEYKRQLMNALHILMLYHDLKDGAAPGFRPVTFLFGGKAAPGYERAKGIIKLINEISRVIRADSVARDLINVVFVANYNVSYAEKLVAAADISEQISMAGTEASGTGNMKFMLNGTATLGTYDGANIEIAESAGVENNYIFGATVEELADIMPRYDPSAVAAANPRIGRALDDLVNGMLDDGGTDAFARLHDALIKGASWHQPDHYYVLGDLASYDKARERAFKEYGSPSFTRKGWLNLCGAGRFSSDKTVADYARNIWRVEPFSP
ncbi:MAG: glycogen/starch/alpha-glucan family phosphorylase [Oscillospiraceae bacterium]|jgi:starch phosphorylase|nr:glycogen/starch/alpha-glucan family phosphorylase [Oscillospiraceae bacterium]